MQWYGDGKPCASQCKSGENGFLRVLLALRPARRLVLERRLSGIHAVVITTRFCFPSTSPDLQATCLCRKHQTQVVCG